MQKRKKTTKGKTGKANYEDDDSREEADRMLPEIDAKGGVESTSRGDARKDWQRMVGGKASAEEIGSVLKTRGENLIETPRVASI